MGSARLQARGGYHEPNLGRVTIAIMFGSGAGKDAAIWILEGSGLTVLKVWCGDQH